MALIAMGRVQQSKGLQLSRRIEVHRNPCIGRVLAVLLQSPFCEKSTAHLASTSGIIRTGKGEGGGSGFLHQTRKSCVTELLIASQCVDVGNSYQQSNLTSCVLGVVRDLKLHADKSTRSTLWCVGESFVSMSDRPAILRYGHSIPS